MRTSADSACVLLDAYHGTSPGAPLIGGQDPVSGKRLPVLWAGNTRSMAEQFQDGEIRRLRVRLERPLVLTDERRAELFGSIGHARVVQKVLESRLGGHTDHDGVIFEDTVDGMEVGDVYAIFPLDGSVDHAVEVVAVLRYDPETGDESASPGFYDVEAGEPDPERIEAEERAAALRVAATQAAPAAADEQLAAARAWARQLSDNELRSELRRLGAQQVQRQRAAAGPRLETLEQLLVRCPMVLRERLAREADVDPSLLGVDDFAEHLADALHVEVAPDGVIEVDRVNQAVVDLVGDLPVALYHHTSTALLEAIGREGLRVGLQTNFFNTQQGVYLSTMCAGEPVSVYSRRAARVHGGEPTVLRVRRRLSEITPDPDDADLAWAQGRQFISPPVPPGDVIWEDGAAPTARPAGVETLGAEKADATRKRRRRP